MTRGGVMEPVDARITIYSSGLAYCSVCAPADMALDALTEAVNVEQPTGISSSWKLDAAGVFADGTPMPRLCESHPDRRHYLFSC